MFQGLPPLTADEHEFEWGTLKGPATTEYKGQDQNEAPRLLVEHFSDLRGWTLVTVSTDMEDHLPCLWARRKDGAPLLPPDKEIERLKALNTRLTGDLAAASETIASLRGRLLSVGVEEGP